nr:barstar family protein [Mycobacterium interjectum]
MTETVNLEQFISHAAAHGACVGILGETTVPLAPPKGFELRKIEGSHTKTRDALYDAFAEAWHFPPWFGRNMDAFDDVMRDLDNIVTTATGRPQASGYLTLITNAHLILAEQPDLFSWFANTVPFYRDYYRDELSPPAAFGLLLSAPAAHADDVRERWQSVGVQVAQVNVSA